jgi:methylated-DNA-protein-cysteine methyltransferase related protein
MSKMSCDKVYQAIRAVPVGEVAGYGEIARRAGMPGQARWVARCLSNNEDPQLPWHRILRSDGRIAFTKDTPEYLEQTLRLRAEGVKLVNGKVQGIKAKPSVDELLWAPLVKTPVKKKVKTMRSKTSPK